MKLSFEKGRKYDFDNQFGSQCVDLFRTYCKSLGLPQVNPVVGAIDIYNHPLPDKYVKYTDMNQVQKGDVVFRGTTATNPYGHVAVVIDRVGDRITVMQQNGFHQIGLETAETGIGAADRWVGFIRPIVAEPIDFEIV
jgi:hypothetical protein